MSMDSSDTVRFSRYGVSIPCFFVVVKQKPCKNARFVGHHKKGGLFLEAMHITRQRIRELADERGVKYTVLCDAMGVSRNYLMDKKQISSPIPAKRLEKAAEKLGTTAKYLRGETDDPEPPRVERESVPVSPDVVEIESRLNAAGHDEWVSYGRFLAEQDRYRRPAGTKTRCVRHYLVPAAAGYASPVAGEDYELLELPDVPAGADFCITVRGDSMEPYIKDGSYVFVKRSADLQDFDVGVFYLNGDVLVKQIVTDSLRNTYLLSANPRREDANRTVSADSDATLMCYGKVLMGRLPPPSYFR